jgi:hypothetical protein
MIPPSRAPCFAVKQGTKLYAEVMADTVVLC